MNGKRILSLVLAMALMVLVPCFSLAEEKLTVEAIFYDVGADQQYAHLFNGFNPNINFEVTNLGDYHAAMMTMIASGNAPDLMMFEGARLQEFGEAGHIYTITNEPWIQESYTPGIVEMMTSPNGEIYGVPFGLYAMGIWYNPEIFAAAGIEKFPETISEMKAACEAIQAAGYTPFSVSNVPWTMEQMYATAISSVYGNDLRTFVADLAANGPKGADLRVEELLDALQIVDMQYEYNTGAVDYAEFLNQYASGKVAMIQMGTWAYPTLIELNPQFEMRYAAIPYTENPEDVTLSTNIGASISVSKQSENAEVCMELLQWLATKEGGERYIECFGMVPCVKDVEFTGAQCLADMLTYVNADRVCGWSQIYFTSAGQTEIDVLSEMYFYDQLKPEEYIQKVFEAWNN